MTPPRWLFCSRSWSRVFPYKGPERKRQRKRRRTLRSRFVPLLSRAMCFDGGSCYIYTPQSEATRSLEPRSMGVLDQRFEKNFMITSVDYVFNWARKSALWPLTFGLACCAIEMIASTTSRFDMARFGAEVFRPSPRQADLMIVSGTDLQ